MAGRRAIWLLVTAHPDDESMFFIPTIRNLLLPNLGRAATAADGRRYRQPRGEDDYDNDDNDDDDDAGPAIHLLCLSNGDYRDALDGPVRTKEIHRACSLIGVRNERGDSTMASVAVLDDDRMKDGPNEVWSPDLVSETLLEHIRKCIVPAAYAGSNVSIKTKHDYILSGPIDEQVQPWTFMEKKNAAQRTNSDEESIQSLDINILTFDKGGVSGHPNHVDTFRGVQYLLNEKCYISRDKLLEPNAKLHLHQERKSSPAHKETFDNIIKLRVSAYSLSTISNPFRKYFLWALADIIPHLFVRLFQMLLYLAYFLVGGVLWGKGGPRIHPFSGIETIDNGKDLQCRIMDPILVWRAMAAHHSQFVWYRRLSVMFSRYTFINDIQKLSVEMPPTDEDADGALLPPVVALKEDKSSPKFLLSLPQMNTLREALLPTGLHHRPWKRIYSLARDGDSFVAFQKLLEEWSMKQAESSTLLVVKTKAGALIGGFADGPMNPMASNYGNAARSCLFKFKSQKDCKDLAIDVYGNHYATSSSKRLVFDATRRIIAFGGGVSDDGPDEGFGLCLEDGFARGTTARCAAFRNEPLVSEQDGIFEVLDVELWGFVFGQF